MGAASSCGKGCTVGVGATSVMAACPLPRGGMGLRAVGAGRGLPVGLLCILKLPLIPREQLAKHSASGSVWCWL